MSENQTIFLSKAEKNKLAEMFVAKGEALAKLLKFYEAKEAFLLALKLAEDNSKIWHRYALFLLSQIGKAKDDKLLKATHHAFKKCMRLNPNFFKACFDWANFLVKRADISLNEEYLTQAIIKFEQAKQIAKQKGIKKPLEFYWNKGYAHMLLGRMTGEAVDFYDAILCFRRAKKKGLTTIDFFLDFGKAYADLAFLLKNPKLLLLSNKLFIEVLSVSKYTYEAIWRLARNYQLLFEETKKIQHFEIANDFFSRAQRLNSKDLRLFYWWGHLLAFAGKMTVNAKLLREGCQKFAKANLLEPNRFNVLKSWADSLLLLGSLTSSLAHINLAKEKLTQCLKINRFDDDIWYLLGSLYNELGRYFEDVSYHEKALSIFLNGIKKNKNLSHFWHGAAVSYFSIGEKNDDVEALKKSAIFCQKLVSFSEKKNPQYFVDWGSTLMHIAEIEGKKKYAEQALAKFQKGIEIVEKNFHQSAPLEWYYHYGCALLFVGDHRDELWTLEQAMKIFQYIIAHDSEFINARFQLAKTATHYAEISGDHNAYMKAFDQYKIITLQDPEDEQAWQDWGMTLMLMSDELAFEGNREGAYQLRLMAEEKFLKAASLGNDSAIYDLACLYSLCGQSKLAIKYLKMADKKNILPSSEDLLEESWLDNVRKTKPFQEILKNLNERK